MTIIFDQAHKIALLTDEKFSNKIHKVVQDAEQKGPDVYSGLGGLLDCTECFSGLSSCTMCAPFRNTLAAEAVHFDEFAEMRCGTLESALTNGYELGDQFVDDWYDGHVRTVVGAILTGLAVETGPAAPAIGVSGVIAIEVSIPPLTAVIYGLAQEACLLAVVTAALLDDDFREALLNLRNCCSINSASCC